MADPTTITVMTNTTVGSCVGVQCDCNTAWSIAQQWSTLRLCTPIGKFKDKLVSNYAVRARRIAATYARFYLELEDGCDVTKKGRFYWMALGAFASKTVACALEYKVVKSVPKDRLGKGNLWLFCDISGWHWYYTKHTSHFDQCLSSRNASSYVDAVQKQMNHLPWKAEALPKIKNMQVSGYIKDGFAKVKAFENETNPTRRPTIQLDHLLKIADHEQRVILQPLIYEDTAFVSTLLLGRNLRWVPNDVLPAMELVFTHACETGDAKLKSIAPEDTKLEDVDNRMKWINTAAEQFHKLMQKSPAMMEKELRTIAGWVDMPDK